MLFLVRLLRVLCSLHCAIVKREKSFFDVRSSETFITVLSIGKYTHISYNTNWTAVGEIGTDFGAFVAHRSRHNI